MCPFTLAKEAFKKNSSDSLRKPFQCVWCEPFVQKLGTMMSFQEIKFGRPLVNFYHWQQSENCLVYDWNSFIICYWIASFLFCPFVIHHLYRERKLPEGRGKPSLVPCLRAPPSEKRSGERSRISWAYYPKRVMTNEIARSVIITYFS